MPRTRTQRFQQTSLPYPYVEEGLELEFDECTVDGAERNLIQGDKNTIRLVGIDNWERATLRGKLTLPQTVVDSVFPEPERDGPPGKLYAAVRSPDTIYRTSTEIAAGTTPADTYDVELVVEHEKVRGDVSVLPFLTRGEEPRGDDAELTPHATTRGVRLSDGEEWTIVVDEFVDSGDHMIDGEEASFSEHQHLPDGDHVYHLDLRNAERPKIWLNSDHSRIMDILHSTGSVGAEARMRDVIMDEVKYAVWSQLILRTAADLDSETYEPRHEWQETVINIFCEDLYDTTDPDVAARRLYEDVTDAENVPYLMETIDNALQTYLNQREQLINLMEEGLML